MTTSPLAAPHESALEFWNRIYSSGTQLRIADGVLPAALAYFGDVRGRRLVDLGCGTGEASVYFAARGAEVIGLDISDVGVQILRSIAAEGRMSNIRAEVCSAMEIERFRPVDLVFGSMILHHLEPFHEFATRLGTAVTPRGRAFFYENNAASRLLIWFREHIVGRFGLPKYGDADEFPLQPHEIELLRSDFDVRVEIPELLFFRLISSHLLPNRLGRLTTALDRWFYPREVLNRYSYRQYVLLERRPRARADEPPQQAVHPRGTADIVRYTDR